MIQNTRRAFTPLHKFACELSEALLNATLILGGKSHWRRAKTLLEDLQMQTGITRKMRNDALILHDLLRREQIHDPERAEAAYFSEIQTEMPVIEELCFLNNKFEDALRATGILPPDDVEI